MKEPLVKRLSLSTRGGNDMHDLTADVQSAVRESGVSGGLATVFVPGSTAGVTTIEFEPGLNKDFADACERLVPESQPYAHNDRWGDGNGHSHVRASLLGPTLSIPVVSGRLVLGTWQQIVLVDFDNRARKRDVVIQVMGMD